MDGSINPHFDRIEDMPEGRRPRVGLMGEFSAGKSTLSNLLVGGNALPVQGKPDRLSYRPDCGSDSTR